MACIALSTAAQSSPTEIEELIKNSSSLLEKSDYAHAIPLLRRAAELAPHDAHANHLLEKSSSFVERVIRCRGISTANSRGRNSSGRSSRRLSRRRRNGDQQICRRRRDISGGSDPLAFIRAGAGVVDWILPGTLSPIVVLTARNLARQSGTAAYRRGQ